VRLFAAIDLDDDALKAIAVLQQRILKTLGAGRSFKTVDSTQMHLTLAFLGEVAESDSAPVIAALSSNIEIHPFAAAFQALGVFPPRGAPRVLWVGVKEGARELVETQLEVAHRVEAAGVTLERRPFHPHLTLGRWRDSRSPDRKRALSADPGGAIAKTDVDHVTLYRSRLTQAGPVYTPLTRANLTSCRPRQFS
jgi:2'-5' RNA ligase